MRSETVTIGSKTIIVKEKTVGELKGLFNENKNVFDGLIKANSTDDVASNVNDILYSKLTELFPVLNNEDIDNAYPSELEELAGAFINVNFTGIKKAIIPLIKTTLAGLTKLQPSS